MVKRADHCGYVAQRRPLDPPLTQRTAGLSLEIDDDEILAGKQQLAQSQVPVAANSLPTDTAGDNLLEPSQHLVAVNDDLPRFRLYFGRQSMNRERQIMQCPLLDVPQRL